MKYNFLNKVYRTLQTRYMKIVKKPTKKQEIGKNASIYLLQLG